jgi:hypothetical protein
LYNLGVEETSNMAGQQVDPLIEAAKSRDLGSVLCRMHSAGCVLDGVDAERKSALFYLDQWGETDSKGKQAAAELRRTIGVVESRKAG